MNAVVARAGRDWLALREPVDAQARSGALVEQLRMRLPATDVLTIHDLGSGTGSMRRWLAPRLQGRQHWIEHDRDIELLVRESTEPASLSADGQEVTVETRAADLRSLSGLTDGCLVTASALLDVLTDDDLTALVTLVARAGVPCLLALSVVGQVRFDPADVHDEDLQHAFNEHQRRQTSLGALLGPEAATAAMRRFEEAGMCVRAEPSPWLLDARCGELLRTWFDEWVEAACEQRPSLADVADAYCELRHRQMRRGDLRVTVQHVDLLAWPA